VIPVFDAQAVYAAVSPAVAFERTRAALTKVRFAFVSICAIFHRRSSFPAYGA